MTQQYIGEKAQELETTPKEVTLTIAVLAFNEAKRVGDCLSSIEGTGEILVIDGFSSDDTARIARDLGARVLQSDLLSPANPGGFAAQRNYAMEQALGEWVFFLDADERFTPELKDELANLLSGSGPLEGVDALRVRRIEHFWGVRTIHTHGAGWQTRLLRRATCRWDERRVHEGVVCQGRVESLQERLLHFSKDSIADYVTTMNRYTTLEAEQAIEERRLLPRRPWTGMARSFIGVYLYKRAYREGAFGLGMALLFAFYSFLCWAKQWESLMKAGTIRPTEPNAPVESRVAATAAWVWRLKSPPSQDFESPEARGSR